MWNLSATYLIVVGATQFSLITTSRLKDFVNSIGWRFENGLTSNSPSSYTNDCMGWHRRTSSTNSADQLISRLYSNCARPRLHHWLSVELDSPPSAIEPSRTLVLVSGTICHSTSLLRLLFTSLHLCWKPASLFPFQNSFECTVPYLLTYILKDKSGWCSWP